ncbi:hypothetical protein JL475_38175 [Streptomyces sp. M2CJ-2]|uniref:hypothetical protein n=1 Tax=Streptomyces sp. M2CJ-2 TaxID=2803948 RepID=UPI001928E6CC|nr:hypothetical protein [Streptomyces sp. M2CJ-2]MBL3671596.1 hypothetical protein [Streptomyces sp. M2CJ-2]
MPRTRGMRIRGITRGAARALRPACTNPDELVALTPDHGRRTPQGERLEDVQSNRRLPDLHGL